MKLSTVAAVSGTAIGGATAVCVSCGVPFFGALGAAALASVLTAGLLLVFPPGNAGVRAAQPPSADLGHLRDDRSPAHAEMERRGKEQRAAWREEREALVETMTAEIAHEVRYPINFFRSIFQRASPGLVLDEEDIDIGREELERLERLVSGLRGRSHPHIERRVVEVSELLDRAEALLRDRIGPRRLTIELREESALRCDADKVTQILINLLANAFDATEGSGRVGVCWQTGPGGGELTVWDTGPGIPSDASRLFAPWFTTKERGTGLGLTITYRLVRAHGWAIEAERRADTTSFIIGVPPSDILENSARIRKSAESESGGEASPDSDRLRRGKVA